MNAILIISLTFSLVLCDHTDDQWNWVNKLPQSPPGNWPQLAGHISSRPISAPNPIPGPLGLFFVDSYPLPDVTVITEVNLTYFDHLKCTKESVIKELLFNTSLLLPLQCNGKQAIIESIYDLQFREHAAPGPQHELNVPQFYAYTTALNGNILKVGSGIITEPPKCAGGYLWRLVVLVANNQYGCVSRTGITSHTIIYSLTLVTGGCSSTCSLVDGWTQFTPPVNNLGPVFTPRDKPVMTAS